MSVGVSWKGEIQAYLSPTCWVFLPLTMIQDICSSFPTLLGQNEPGWLGWVMVPTSWDVPRSQVEGAGFAGGWSRHLHWETGELGVKKVLLNGEYRL